MLDTLSSSGSQESSSSSSTKLLRLVTYLSELAKLSTRTVRQYEEYQKVLWMHSLPAEPQCYTRAWGKSEEHDDDVWIEIKKYPEPALPRVPEICKDWVKPETLRTPSAPPKLSSSIIRQHQESDPETGEIYTIPDALFLADFPEVERAWGEYLEKKWAPWAPDYERYLAVQKVYGDIFQIYQEIQRLGEQYELVFCRGLLTWKTPAGHDIKRHVVTMRASIDFEPHLGRFTVRAPADGEDLRIELSDMLDPQDQPPNLRRLIEEGEKSFSQDCWSRPDLDVLLTSLANSLADGGQGQYYPEHSAPEGGAATATPRIDYAPALILRKRNMRGLEQVLQKMKTQIEQETSIPDEFAKLGEIRKAAGSDPWSLFDRAVSPEDDEIYFPLLTNEEQERIISTINRQSGVLVQGPPGTGKSHTIANLICHLLATGKRVLVTAKTPRALQVLHDKMPVELRPLCISLLGEGAEERESLEKSVEGILNRLDRRNDSRDAQRVEELTRVLRQKRQEKAETDRKIVALREAETFRHTLAEGAYAGTAAEIARQIKDAEPEFGWLEDRIPETAPFLFSAEDITTLCNSLVEFDQETERELGLFLPDPAADLPQPDTVGSVFEKEAAAAAQVEQYRDVLSSAVAEILERAAGADIQGLFISLGTVRTETARVSGRGLPWIPQAVREVLSGYDIPWRELLKVSAAKAEAITAQAGTVDAFDIAIPDSLERSAVWADAAQLLAHFNSGGRAGFWLFKPKTIRQHGGIMRSVRVNGVPCTTPAALQQLIEYLEVEQGLKYLWKLWSGLAAPKREAFQLQLSEIAELHEALQEVLRLSERREEAQKWIRRVPGLADPQWDDLASLAALEQSCRAVLAKRQWQDIAGHRSRIEEQLRGLAKNANAHPIVGQLFWAFSDQDAARYAELLADLTRVWDQARRFRRKREILGRLADAAPRLAGSIAHGDAAEVWSERLKKLEPAWQWGRAVSWLNGFLHSDIMSLERSVRRTEDDLRQSLAALAAVKAWQCCFARMTDDHRWHLMAWQQAVKKLGKGTGKLAHVHRKNAQSHIKECRGSVPAWIMPLHRVYETVEPGAGIFDVIIIDEASQAGPEALPLLYLGKQVVVVGDDKQISPEAVGVNRDHAQQLMRDLLGDFAHSDSFDVDKSLFDHARIRFANTIALREHFRCMPEIINFSNNLCYYSNPLLPLRQFSPDRLEPLKSVFVAEGYREGKYQRVLNRPEAEKLVETVVSCCKDERYQGMTMGVIVLQGEQQAYHIEDLLLKKLGAEEMKERRLICGNPYSFQGDERHVIFLSMVAAPNERIGTLTKDADLRRFNVAASRAMDQMWLFHSATVNDLSEQCLRRKLLEYFRNPRSRLIQALGENADELAQKALKANRTIERPPQPFDSWFEVDVALQIAGRGYRVVPQYEFADKRIDLVVQGAKAQLAVECDGDYWHGRDRYEADMERQRKLERCSWQFFRVRGSAYYAAPEKAMEPLWEELSRMGIVPVQEQDSPAAASGEAVADDDTGPEPSDTKPFSVKKQEQQLLSFAFDDAAQDAIPHPQNIQEALQAKPSVLGRVIIEILKEKPNNSCIRSNMPAEVLKAWDIHSRGKPRESFARKVDSQIAEMERKGYLIVYKSKNIRVRLAQRG